MPGSEVDPRSPYFDSGKRFRDRLLGFPVGCHKGSFKGIFYGSIRV